MWTAEIVEEVRRIRNEHAARLNYDLGAIVADLQRTQGKDGRTVVRLDPCQPSSSVPPGEETEALAG